MFLLGLFVVNVTIYFAIVLYCKLTCGINKCSRHLVGKVVVVTGGNNGIGYETAKDLADRGARVIIACRSVEKGTVARDKIISETENKDVHFKQLDLASFKSVRAFAEDILKNEKQLDILINNAGMFGSGHTNTEDGLLLDMQTNHFGPFLLTSLLLPLLESSAPSRIVNVTSMAHSFAELDFDNLNFENGKYNANNVYSTTKLCNVLMTLELAKRLKGTGVTANSLHPGAVHTDMVPRIPLLKYTQPLMKLIFKNRWEGAQTSIYLAVSHELKTVSGKYFVDCREKSTAAAAQNAESALKLWQISEKLSIVECDSSNNVLLGLFVVSFSIYFAIIIYCKLTCGINKCSRHLVGKVVIVTGGNTGIGYETAKDLADRGAKVIIACRSVEKGTAARDKIVSETENKDVHFKQLDLASFKSVRTFAEDILKSLIKLDILINNAGMIGSGHTNTEDGLLLDMQTNHFGPFLLTSLLLPLLESSAPSRIVNVSSMAHSFAKLDFKNLNFGYGKYNSNTVYSTSKLCNVLMTVELAKRLKGTGVTANSLHPGGVHTDIVSRVPLLKYTLPFFLLMFKTRWEGAQTTIYLAVSRELKDVSGKYFADCREKSTAAAAQNADSALKLWQISEKLVGIKK